MAGPVTAAQAHDHDGNGAPRKVVSAYFADWDIYGRGYFVKDIPAGQLNVIQYAFAVPMFNKATGAISCDILDPWADFQRPAGAADSVDAVADDAANAGQHLFGNFNQLRKLKQKFPKSEERGTSSLRVFNSVSWCVYPRMRRGFPWNR